jgi:hypothetical protein
LNRIVAWKSNRFEEWKQLVLRSLQLGIAILFHPIDGYRELRNNRSLTTAFFLIFLTLCVRIVTIYLTSFHLTNLQPQDANLLLEVARFVLPLISGTIAIYLITAIMDGEAFFGDVLAAMAYAMMPYIVFSIPVSALSLILSRGELGLYTSLNTIIWCWVGLLVFMQIWVLNEYTFQKAIGVTLLSLFAFVTFWATIGLVFALTNHVLQFIREVAIEIRFITDK